MRKRLGHYKSAVVYNPLRYSRLIAFQKQWTGVASTTIVLLGWVEFMYGGKVTMFVGRHGFFKIVPPTPNLGEQPLLHNEPKPGTKEQRRVVQQLNQLRFCNPLNCVDFVWMRLEGQAILGGNGVKQDIINLMLSPGATAFAAIVQISKRHV